MKTLISLLAITACIFVLLSLALYLLQDKMVFLAKMPGRALTALPGDMGFEYENVSLVTDDDEIIPFEMGQSVYAAVKQRKSFLELRGDHNNGFFISRHDYVAGLDDFIRSVLGAAE